MEIKKFGSIYLAGVAQIPGFDCDDSGDISFSDTVPGRELQWVRLQSGLLVADRCACKKISWEQLDQMGFVFGFPVRIDGEYYLCRCLKVGADESEPNEWDDALDKAGEDDTLWHCERVYFWGQETSKYGAKYRAVRGWVSARGWSHYDATKRNVSIGFRPALEYLGSELYSPDALLGKSTKVYGPGGVTIEGSLVDFSDYDLVLKASPPVRADRSWISKKGRNIIVSRENIIWLKEAGIEN